MVQMSVNVSRRQLVLHIPSVFLPCRKDGDGLERATRHVRWYTCVNPKDVSLPPNFSILCNVINGHLATK